MNSRRRVNSNVVRFDLGLNMLQRLLPLTITLLFLLPMSASVKAQGFSSLQLSPDGQHSYQVLLTAPQFEDDAIGYAAQPSRLVAAYRILLKEPSADAAFKSLLESATPAGQLYALCGVYYTDNQFFLTTVEKHAERTDFVHAQFGCIGGTMRVSALVKTNAPNVVRLSTPKQSIADWQSKNPALTKNGFLVDIFGGGYPSMFSRQYNSN
jgi:hypothetical protein